MAVALVERPRERMILYGGGALADIELLALVLGGGKALQRADRLLRTHGGLGGLGTALVHELCGTAGVGEAGASAVCAAFELGRRVRGLGLPYARPLRDPSDVGAYVRAMFGDAPQELFVVLGLDARQRVRMVRTVAMGTVAQVDVHPREVFRPLVRAGMHAAILVHNHPSGEPQPSEADVALTERMAEVGRLVGIPVLDHLVVTPAQAVSLLALGLL